MKNLTLQFRTALLLTLILLAGTAAYGQITPLGDSYINTATPTTNYGAKTLLDVDGATQTTYIQFNLASVPATASVSQATLKIYVNSVTTAGSFNVDYVNGSWTEGTIDSSNAPPLGAAIASNVNVTTADKNQYILVNVTSAVQAWLNGSETNNGLALVANSSFNATFDSKENTTTSHPPELDIAFAGGDGTITGVTTAGGSGLTGGGTSGTLNLSLTNGCAANQVLQYNGSAWACAAVGTGTITGVTAGTDLTGGGTSGNVTLSLNTTALNSSYAQLGAANTFSANQTLNGTLTANSSTNSVIGNSTGANSPAVVGSGNGDGVLGSASSTSGTGVLGSATATTGATYGVLGTASSTSGTGVSGQASATTGTTVGVFGIAASSAGYGVEGYNEATTGTAEGVFGYSQSTGGYGVVGQSPYIGVSGSGGEFGVLGQSSTGNGVQGNATATTGSASGVVGTTSSPTANGVTGQSPYVGVWGTGADGVVGMSTSNPGAGVVGISWVTGDTIGVIGEVNSPNGIGVEGTSPNVGVYGEASSSSVTGEGYGLAGVWGDTGGEGGGSSYIGVLGTADEGFAGLFLNNSPGGAVPLFAQNNTATDGGMVFAAVMPNLMGPTAFAIIGDPGCAESSGNISLQLGQEGMSGCSNYTLAGNNQGNTYLNANAGEGIYLRINNSNQLTVTSGKVDVIGTLSKGGGSFKIDHPLDPANKYLYHSFVESPDMMNIYNGNVTTDGAGRATVTLPDWFEALNTDFRYQLTVMGQFAQAIVASEVSQNQFRIRTDKPNVKVSWQVTGIRHDAFANANRIPVEVEKAPADRGRYLYPEAIGAPASARIGYDNMPSPEGEHIVHHLRAIPRRGNASPSQRRSPLVPPAPPKLVLPKAPPLPPVPTAVSRPELNQK